MVLSRPDLIDRIERGEIVEPESVEDSAEMVENVSVSLTIDKDMNKISNSIYAEGVDRDDAKNHPVPSNEFYIPGREIAVLTTRETLAMPADLVGSVGIRLSASKRGIVPLFGPQVEPGFNDRFYAVVYNASEEDFNLNDINGGILKLEVSELSTPLPEDQVEYDSKLNGNDRIPEPLQVDTATPNIETLETNVENARRAVDEVENGYMQVVLFGIFLLATATLSAVLPAVIEAASSTTFGLNFPTIALSFFILLWGLTGFVIIYHSIVGNRS